MQYDQAEALSPGPKAACLVWAGEVDYLVAERWMEWWSCFGQPFHHSRSRPAQKTRNIYLVPALMLTLSTKQARKDNQYPLIATIRILTSFSLRCAALKKRKEHLAVPFPVIYFLLLTFSFLLFQYVFYAPLKSLTKTTANTEKFTPKHFTHLLSQCTLVMFTGVYMFSTVYLHPTVLLGKLRSRLRAILFTKALCGTFSSLTALSCRGNLPLCKLKPAALTTLVQICYIIIL